MAPGTSETTDKLGRNHTFSARLQVQRGGFPFRAFARPSRRSAGPRCQMLQSQRINGPHRQWLHSHDVWGLRASGDTKKMMFVKSRRDHFYSTILFWCQAKVSSVQPPTRLGWGFYFFCPCRSSSPTQTPTA